MKRTRNSITGLFLLAFLLFTACEEGGEYKSIPFVPAQVVVLYNVYNVQNGMEVSYLPEMENVGLQEFPEGVAEGTPWVVRGTYRDMTCEDTLYLPAVKPGETAYCHLNLFLCPSGYEVTGMVENLEGTTSYAAIPEARTYKYKDFDWFENPTEALYSTTVEPDCPVEYEIEMVNYFTSGINRWGYEMLMLSIPYEHEYNLEEFNYYQSAWSLSRLFRKAQDRRYTYTLTFKGRKEMDFTVMERNSVVIYSQEEIAHPECADMYRKGEGYGIFYWTIGDYYVPDRSGGGIFYDD